MRGTWQEITIFPFVYLYAMLMIAAFPLLKFNDTSVDRIRMPNKSVFQVFLWILIISSLLQIPKIVNDLQTGIPLILSNIDNAAEIYNDRNELSLKTTHSVADFVVNSPISIIANIFSDFCIFFFFYCQTFKQKTLSIQILLFVIILLSLLRPISKADRTEAMLTLLVITATYCLFWEYISKDRRRQMNRFIAILGSIIVIPIAIITISRFSAEDGGISSSVVKYMGEENLYFNNEVLSANGTREGERTCNIFKQMLGYDDVATDVRSLRSKYPFVGIDDTHFTTFVGDFVIDFGPVIPVFMFLFFSFFFTKLTKTVKRTISFHQLILLYFTMIVCVKGSMYLFVFSFTNNYKIMAFAFAYLLFLLSDTGMGGYLYKANKNVIGS